MTQLFTIKNWQHNPRHRKWTNAYGSAQAGQGPSSRIYQQRRAKLQEKGAQRLKRQADKAKPPQISLFKETTP